MSSGDFGWQGYRYGWWGAAECGMVDREGDATINEYIEKAALERCERQRQSENDAEKARLEKEAAAKAEEERQILEMRRRLQQYGSLYRRALNLEPLK